MLKKINLRQKFDSFDAPWQPKIIASANEIDLKAVKLDGEFIWHHHDDEDEIFIVLRGRLDMHFRSNGAEFVESFGEGELLKVPRGVEHKPVAAAGTEVLLIERATTLNTGNIIDSDRRVDPEVI